MKVKRPLSRFYSVNRDIVHTPFALSQRDYGLGRGEPPKNTRFTVWRWPTTFISLQLYSTDAPIEQVPVHWGTDTCSLLKPPYGVQRSQIHIAGDSSSIPSRLSLFRLA